MRPTPSRSTARDRRRRVSVPALGLAALAVTAIAAAPAGAATPRFATIDQPLQPAAGATTAAGDGHVAWVTKEAADPAGTGPTSALWTVKDGVPTKVASIPTGTRSRGSVELEVGTAAGGTPVVAVKTLVSDDGRSAFRLVDLDTGAVKRVSATRGGSPVYGVAVNDGLIYTTVHVPKVGRKNTSALWRAPLTGLTPGKATKLRGSRRGESWSEVLADRGRVAIRTNRVVQSGGRDGWLEQIAFGTPRGAWRRTGDVLIQEGPVNLVGIGGFTQDRTGLVTLQSPDDGTLRATLTSSGTGKTTKTAFLGTTPRESLNGASFVPATGRFLGEGPDAAGVAQLGYTAPVFPTGGATR